MLRACCRTLIRTAHWGNFIRKNMANFISNCFRCSAEKTIFHEGSRRLLKKLFIFLAFAQLLVIFLCQIASKDSTIYLHLRKLNLAIYLPSSIALPENYSADFITNPAHRALRLLQRTSWLPTSEGVEPINFTWLEKNPVYAQFGLKEAAVKKRVTVLVIVSSAPRRFDRRQAIRETWWTECKKVNEVTPECIFMTDHPKEGDPYYKDLKSESDHHKDIFFQNVPGGITFGLRMLHHMIFALTRYNFDYFFRADDDYFFCFDQFLHEVPVPMVTNFHWGWVHRVPTIIRPEESMIMFSRDVVQMFLEQDPNEIMCHPWADQMIGEWSNVLNMTYLYRHDDRIHHTPIVSEQPSLRMVPNICSLFISVHGTYPDDMRLFWTHHRREKQTSLERNLIFNSETIPIDSDFDWRTFDPPWSYEPKRCITNPTWDTSKQFVMGGAYSGREDEHKAPVLEE